MLAAYKWTSRLAFYLLQEFSHGTTQQGSDRDVDPARELFC